MVAELNTQTLAVDVVDEPQETPFETDLMWEGVETGDGRVFEQVDHRDLPLPLMLQTETAFGHDGAVIAGRIEEITLGGPGGLVTARGHYLADENGQRGAELAANETLNGVSVDLGDVEIVEEEVREVDEETGMPTDVLVRVIGVRIMGATQTPFPAFADAQVRVVEEGETSPEEDEEGEPSPEPEEDESVAASIVASASSKRPADWFSDPTLDAPTPLTVTPEGRVFGHIAEWNTCHTGNQASCVTPPRGSNYSYFLTGEVETDDGSRVPVGQLTLAGGHAELGANWMQAKAHYDSTNSAVADITVGEDGHGIWCSGAVRPGVTEEEVAVLMASAPSGDWRRIGGKFEFIAVCAVNAPGFPVSRVAGAHLVNGRPEGGEPVALVAAAAPRRAGQASSCGCRSQLTQQVAVKLDAGQVDAIEREFETLRRRIRGLAFLRGRS